MCTDELVRSYEGLNYNISIYNKHVVRGAKSLSTQKWRSGYHCAERVLDYMSPVVAGEVLQDDSAQKHEEEEQRVGKIEACTQCAPA